MRRTDAQGFTAEVDALCREAEDLRLLYMRAMQSRIFISVTISLVCALAGAVGFGWYFLYEGRLIEAVACVVLGALPWFPLMIWSKRPGKTYLKAHKRDFMPKMAKILGGFRYEPTGGIGEKILPYTGVVPDHDRYLAEDCFIGRHKGIKVILSEANLSLRGRRLFHGLFVLLELPQKTLEGHVVLTSDRAVAKNIAQGQGGVSLAEIAIRKSGGEGGVSFQVFADNPEHASLVTGEKLIKELSEAARMCSEGVLTASLFRGKYIFLMLPSKDNLFEASKLEEPIASKDNIMARRREIDKIMEIIDIFEIYRGSSAKIP